MNGDVIDTERKTKQSVNQKPLSHYSKKVICQSCLFKLRNFAALCLRSLHSKKKTRKLISTSQKEAVSVHLR